jgi:TetR/AcrR family transcriptional regulator of autoinduction and epiphytic fitness
MAEYIRQPGRADAVMAKLKLQEGGLESWLAAAVADDRLQAMDVQIATHQFWGLFKAFFFWPKVLQSQGYDGMSEEIIKNNVLMFLAFYQKK